MTAGEPTATAQAQASRVPSGLISAPDGPTHTWPTTLRDYPEWHLGRTRYGVWVAMVTQPELLTWWHAARDALADLLHTTGTRQPHLTVFVCGFESPTREHADDFTPARLAGQIGQLQRLAPAACQLPLGPVDSFASAAFLGVRDPDGQLARWRQALATTSREIRQQAYQPHITLGLYRHRLAADLIRQRLATLPPPPTTLTVSALEYVTYAVRKQLGPLTSQHRVELQQRV